jgi:uncharacterized membrane protein YqjE
VLRLLNSSVFAINLTMKKLILPKIAIVAALAAITLIACSKSDGQNAVVISEAIIYNTGSIAADGCGWTLKATVNDSTYSPKNLDDQYKVNNLKVKVRFHPMRTKLTCGLGAAQLREITIDNIVRIP